MKIVNRLLIIYFCNKTQVNTRIRFQNDLMPETELEAEDLIKIRKDSVNSITTDEEGETISVSEFKTPSRLEFYSNEDP